MIPTLTQEQRFRLRAALSALRSAGVEYYDVGTCVECDDPWIGRVGTYGHSECDACGECRGVQSAELIVERFHADASERSLVRALRHVGGGTGNPNPYAGGV